METIVASIIVGCLGIIVALIGAILSNRKVNIVAECNKTLLSKDHTGFKDDHKAMLAQSAASHEKLSAQSAASHEKLSAQNLTINDNVKGIHHYMELKDARASAYSSKELDVVNTVEHLTVLVSLLAEKSERIAALENEIARLKLQQQEQPTATHSQNNDNDDELER